MACPPGGVLRTNPQQGVSSSTSTALLSAIRDCRRSRDPRCRQALGGFRVCGVVDHAAEQHTPSATTRTHSAPGHRSSKRKARHRESPWINLALTHHRRHTALRRPARQRTELEPAAASSATQLARYTRQDRMRSAAANTSVALASMSFANSTSAPYGGSIAAPDCCM
jgi:hypothetical protein